MTEEELVAIIYDELSNSEFTWSEDQASRAKALDYYNALGLAIEDPDNPICEGRSKLVSNDVGDTVDACMAQMMPSFVSAAAQFEPLSEQDEDSADEESKIVDYFLMDKNRGYNVLRDALFDCLLEKNCNVKVSWCEDEFVDNQTFENLSLEELQMQVMQVAQDENSEIIDFNEGQEGYSLEVKTTITDAYPKVETFAPEELRVNADHDSPSVKDARFVCHKPSDVTVSDLIIAGHPRAVVEALDDYTWNNDMAASTRGGRNNQQQLETSGPNRILDYHEVYMHVDWDNDGIAELRRILMVGKTILENDPIAHCQIITGAVMPNPHQFSAMSLFDKLMGIQDTKTQLIRQVVDNAAISINNRLEVVSDQILNPDELMTSRPGGIIQVKTPGAIRELQTPQMDQSVMALMSYMDKMRTERAGSALDMTSENIPIGANATAHGTERVITSMEQMQAQMTTNFAELVIRELYVQIHYLLRKHAGDTINIKSGNQYLQSDPRQWPHRDKLNVQVGVSAGERSRKAKAVSAVVQNQLMMLQLGGGGTMLNQRGMYKANVDLGNYMGIDFPEQYYLDPESPEAQQNAQKQAAQEQAKMQKAEQDKQQMLQFQAMLQKEQEDTKRSGDQLKDDQFYEELSFKYDELMSDKNLSLIEIEAKHDVEVEKINAKPDAVRLPATE